MWKRNNADNARRGDKVNIINIQIDDLKPYAHNPKTHPAEQVEKIARSISEFGFLVPILIDADNSIIAGHGRLMAARKLGLIEVPTIQVDHLTEAQIRAYRIADNRLTESAWDIELLESEIAILQDMDFDIDLTGFDDIELGELFPSDPEPEDFDAEEAMDEEGAPLVQAGELWVLGDHRLLCGDSTKSEDVGRLMDGEKADMVFTDPPYNVDYVPEDRPIGGRALSVNKLGGIMNDINFDICALIRSFPDYVHGAVYLCSGCKDAPEIEITNREVFGRESTWIVWAKNNHSIGRRDYHRKHEFVFYNWFDKKHWDGARNDWDLWEIDRDNPVGYMHPTQKPVEIPTRAINHSCPHAGSVLDLFGGSGSTLIACEQLKRRCYMMELDPHYCSAILDRWANYTKEDPIREDGMMWSELKESQQP